MGPWKKALVHVAWSSLFVSAFPGAILPAAAQQVAAPTREASPATSGVPLMAKVEEPPALSELPDSPGAVASKSEASAQQQSGSGSPAVPAQPAQSTTSQAQSSGQKPVGTAAAEAPDASGIAASQPAGVAIAPAKQRRTRTIILRMGAIVGAGVAIGSVVALTEGTSSKPPGAH
ncbi:MAG: hypothetical protein ACYDDS_17895 [Candidatus Sulfotelmatobacter sp.]